MFRELFLYELPLPASSPVTLSSFLPRPPLSAQGAFSTAYQGYASGYQGAQKRLRELIAERPKFAAWVTERTKERLHSFQGMEHLLVQPIQRFPRYRLLFEVIGSDHMV